MEQCPQCKLRASHYLQSAHRPNLRVCGRCDYRWDTEKGEAMSRPTMQQLADRLARATGGISVAIADGTEPTDGFIVSLYGPELRLGPDVRAQTYLIGAWLGCVLPYAHNRHSGLFVGRWTDENGFTYFDVSVRCETLNLAVRMGKANKQQSIYCVATGESVSVA